MSNLTSRSSAVLREMRADRDTVSTAAVSFDLQAHVDLAARACHDLVPARGLLGCSVTATARGGVNTVIDTVGSLHGPYRGYSGHPSLGVDALSLYEHLAQWMSEETEIGVSKLMCPLPSHQDEWTLALAPLQVDVSGAEPGSVWRLCSESREVVDQFL
jgi:hypothetical protein